ncbi:PorP/SprF family type IX secretion system membrane protein [Bizionia sp. KMM 8389]
MSKNYFFVLPIYFILAFTSIKAQDMPVLSFSVPHQNNIKFNRFIQNPTYSFVGENNTYISLYHRNQWIQFNDSPKAYMLSYTGRFNEKSGMGIGVYQQSTGVISSFGAIGNYAHSIKLNTDLQLTLGFNLAYYSSGVDNNRTITAEDDPLLLSFRSTSLVTIKPGINLSYKQFDFGIYAENLVDYDFRSSEMASQYIDRSYSSQLMYTHNFNAATGLFEDTDMRLALTAQITDSFGTGFGGSILTNFPRMGWIQLGVDNYYGVGAGFGAHVSKRLSIGYTYERTIKEGLVNLGPTHEVNLVFAIKNSRKDRGLTEFASKTTTNTDSISNAQSQTQNNEPQTTTTTTTTQKTVTTTTTITTSGTSLAYDETNNLEALRKMQSDKVASLQAQLDEENQYLLEILLKENDLNNLKKATLEEQIRNLQSYAQRENQTNTLPTENIKTIEFRATTPVTNPIDPKHIEDLKFAKNGYYLVSKTDTTYKFINRFDELPDAIRAYNLNYKEKAIEELYIIHVDNPLNTETKFNTNQPTKTISNATNLPLETNQNSPINDNVTFSGLNALTPRATKLANESNTQTRRTDDSIPREKILGNRLVTSMSLTTGSIPNTNNDKIDNSENKTTNTNKETNNTNEINSENSKTPQKPIAKNDPKKANKPKKTVKQYEDNYDTETRRNSVSLSLTGVEPGYYIVANVFSQFSNAENFINDLKSQGLSPSYFKNPRNKYTYVYLKHFDDWRSASKAFHSKLNNRYTGKIWIMSINIE